MNNTTFSQDYLFVTILRIVEDTKGAIRIRIRVSSSFSSSGISRVNLVTYIHI